VAQPEAAQLPAHEVDVLGAGHGRVPARLDGVLLGRQAEGVEAERVQHQPALHAHEAGVDVGGDVAERVPDMQAGARGVGEHVEHVQPLAPDPVGRPGRRVGDHEGPALGPPPLPARLDLAGQLGGVAAGGGGLGVPRHGRLRVSDR
jgi:hypothetical protein